MGSKEYFVYFEITYCTAGAKDPLRDGKMLQECALIKRERGECFIHPAVAPVSRMSALQLWNYPRTNSSGGQNLAALCTAAGQNLAAVGSSHSLTETVNLGAMTAAGLVGTLHNTFTSYKIEMSMLDSRLRGRSNTWFMAYRCHTEPV